MLAAALLLDVLSIAFDTFTLRHVSYCFGMPNPATVMINIHSEDSIGIASLQKTLRTFSTKKIIRKTK